MATEALVTRGHEQADTVVGQHTLLHGETLLVLATHDLEHIALRRGGKADLGGQLGLLFHHA